VLDRAPEHTATGGNAVMSQFFNWLNANAPQYLQ
jgi:hypothetical protein